jgi:hypothetical protein
MKSYACKTNAEILETLKVTVCAGTPKQVTGFIIRVVDHPDPVQDPVPMVEVMLVSGETRWCHPDDITSLDELPAPKEFICAHDDVYNCGTVTQRTFKYGEPDWVHTGEPNAPGMKGLPFCDKDGKLPATPSTMEIA